MQTLLQSNDSIELYIALWAQGFYEVEDSIDSCRKLIKDGTKNQRLVVSYYNHVLQRPKYSGKVANYVFETYPEDVELCAAFLPTYMPNSGYAVNDALWGTGNRYYYYRNGERNYKFEPVSFKLYFDNEEQARRHFELLKQLKAVLPKKGQMFSPCIFPLYSVSINHAGLAANMALIAYMLQDQALIDEACTMLTEMETHSRWEFLCLLTHNPKTEVQRQTLLQALGDKGSDTREEAFFLVSKLKLDRKDYAQIQTCLKYKAADIRNNVLSLLEKQDDEDLKDTIDELLANKKEEVRLGGLDLVVRLKKNEQRQSLYKTCQSSLAKMENVTEKEAVILQELIGESQADSVLQEEGYGLYNPNAEWNLPAFKGDAKFISTLFRKAKELYEILDKLDALYTANEEREYTAGNGQEYLLGNVFYMTDYSKDSTVIDSYPFPELWRDFYNEHIKDFITLLNLRIIIINSEDSVYERGRMDWFVQFAEQMYGKDFVTSDFSKYKYTQEIYRVIKLLFTTYQREEENEKLLVQAARSMFAVFMEQPKEKSMRMLTAQWQKKEIPYYAMECEWFEPICDMAKIWNTNEEFDEMFLACHSINVFYGDNAMDRNFLDYVKAYKRNLISLDNVYQASFDIIGLEKFFQHMSPVIEQQYRRGMNQASIERYIKSDGEMEENPIFLTAEEIYWNITEMILKVKLKRSETETDFSYVINKICKIKGVEHLLDILTALGKDTLDRSVYYRYYGGNNDKKTCLCHLLNVIEPLPDENGETLRKLMKGRKISDKRLVEVAIS